MPAIPHILTSTARAEARSSFDHDLAYVLILLSRNAFRPSLLAGISEQNAPLAAPQEADQAGLDLALRTYSSVSTLDERFSSVDSDWETSSAPAILRSAVVYAKRK
jgi:hypothetical protein